MKKTAFVLLVAVCFVFFFSVSAFAEENESEKIMDEFSQILPEESGVDAEGDIASQVSFESIFSQIISALGGRWDDISSFFLHKFL